MMQSPRRSGRILGYRERQVIEFVLRYYLEHSQPPTRREIQDGVGLGSKGEVTRIIQRIERRGIVRPFCRDRL